MFPSTTGPNRKRAERRLALETDLRQGLDETSFVMHYQLYDESAATRCRASITDRW